jgi:hypothetical protein
MFALFSFAESGVQLNSTPRRSGKRENVKKGKQLKNIPDFAFPPLTISPLPLFWSL